MAVNKIKDSSDNDKDKPRKDKEMNKGQLKNTAQLTNQLTLVYQPHPYTCLLAGTDPRLHLHSRLVLSQIQIPSA